MTHICYAIGHKIKGKAMTPDRARLEAIKELALNCDPDDAVAMVTDDIPQLIEWFEEALELLHVESSLVPAGKENTRVIAFLSRFEDGK